MYQQIKKVYSKIKKGNTYRDAVKLYRSIQNIRHLADDKTGLYCPGCKKYWKSFKPFPKQWLQQLNGSGWPYKPDDVETLNYRDYTCYGCGINDRDRLYILYFEKKLDKQQQYKIIEFAPRPSLSNFLKSHPNVLHRTADLFMDNVDDKLDIQYMHLYEANSFDVFICSHILEHVTDDIKAMKELYRILKPGGFGITMVPILLPVTATIEDPTITDSNLRLKYYGQSDHVRLYAKQQFIQRLTDVGFKVNLYSIDHFEEGLFEKYGITQKSVLYIVQK